MTEDPTRGIVSVEITAAIVALERAAKALNSGKAKEVDRLLARARKYVDGALWSRSPRGAAAARALRTRVSPRKPSIKRGGAL